jgi:hypothetical protein
MDYDLTPLGELRRATDELLMVRSSTTSLGKEVTIAKGVEQTFSCPKAFPPSPSSISIPGWIIRSTQRSNIWSRET